MSSHSEESWGTSSRRERGTERELEQCGERKREEWAPSIQFTVSTFEQMQKKKKKREEENPTHQLVKMCTDTWETPRHKNAVGWTFHAWTDQRSTVQWYFLDNNTPSGPEWVSHATGTLLSDSAGSVQPGCRAVTQTTVKWLFQSPHKPWCGGTQPTSCTGRNRKCVKRRVHPHHHGSIMFQSTLNGDLSPIMFAKMRAAY